MKYYGKNGVPVLLFVLYYCIIIKPYVGPALYCLVLYYYLLYYCVLCVICVLFILYCIIAAVLCIIIIIVVIGCGTDKQQYCMYYCVIAAVMWHIMCTNIMAPREVGQKDIIICIVWPSRRTDST